MKTVAASLNRYQMENISGPQLLFVISVGEKYRNYLQDKFNCSIFVSVLNWKKKIMHSTTNT